MFPQTSTRKWGDALSKNSEHFIVDGYNLIYASKELKEMMSDLSAARDRLLHILSEYGAYEKYRITVVFDAPNTLDDEHGETIDEYLRVIYTGAGETADSRIERLAYDLARQKATVYVVTSDGAEQSVVLGAGGYRIPSREFVKMLRRTKNHIRGEYVGKNILPLARHDVSTRIDADTAAKLDALRKERE